MTVILSRGDVAAALDIDDTIAALGDGSGGTSRPPSRASGYAPSCPARARR